MERDRPHTRRPGGPLIVIAAIIGIIVVTVFVGYNLFHAKTMQQENSRSLD